MLDKEVALDALIPPPDPLPANVYLPDEAAAQKIVACTTLQSVRLNTPREIAASEEAEAREEESGEKELGEEEVEKTEEVVSEVLAKDDITSFYSLEFKELYNSPNILGRE